MSSKTRCVACGSWSNDFNCCETPTTVGKIEFCKSDLESTAKEFNDAMNAINDHTFDSHAYNETYKELLNPNSLKFPPPKAQDAGLKYDSGKEAVSLIPPDALLAVGAVMEYGAKKYAAHNWSKGIKYTRLADAAQRHLLKFMSPNHSSIDNESSLHHLAHTAVNILMLLQFEIEKRTDLDDRYKRDQNVK